MNASDVHHRRVNGHALAPRARTVSRRLHICPPHSWDCPVLMKIDPGSVAWTCSKCGAIATVPVGTPRPDGPIG